MEQPVLLNPSVPAGVQENSGDAPPSVTPAAMSASPGFVRVLSVAIGFSFSAGWDWFPAMHPLWLSDYIYLDAPSDPIGPFGSLSSFVFIKALILIVLGIGVEKIFSSLLTRRNEGTPSLPPPVSFFRALCWFGSPTASHPVLGGLSFSSNIRDRLYDTLPFALVQASAVVLILILTFFLPFCLLDWIPVLLGTISALLGLLWFSIMAMLPAVWCCLAYGLAVLCSLGLYLLTTLLSPDALFWLRLLCPQLAFPLLFFALPPSAPLRESVQRRLQASFSLAQSPHAVPGFSTFFDLRPRLFFSCVGLFVFTLLYGLQLLLGFASGSFIVADSTQPILGAQTGMVLMAQALGAFLAAGLRGHTLIIPMLGLALFGAGSVLVSLVSDTVVLVPSFFLYMATGACAAFGVSLLGAFFQAGSHVFRTIAWGLFFINSFGYFGGYGLWVVANQIENDALSSRDLYMQLLALVSLMGMLSLYGLRRPLEKLLGAPEVPVSEPDVVEPDQSLQLTRREREVAGLVQEGMKNLEISVHLNITEATLRVHLRHIYKKLGIQNRSALRCISLDDQPSK